MEPSSPSQTPAPRLNPRPKPPDAWLQEAIQIRELVQEVGSLLRRQQESNALLAQSIADIARCLDGFTSGGASFHAYQINPILLVYASILGPILGDRIDADRSREGDYLEEMTKGAAVMAQRLLRTLDEYQSNSAALDYLRATCGDIEPPEPSSPAS